MEENERLVEEGQKYEQIIEGLEERYKNEVERYQNREKKSQRDLASEKRRTLDLQRQV